MSGCECCCWRIKSLMEIYICLRKKLFFSGDIQIIKWFGVDIESIDKTHLIQKEDLRIDESHPPVDVLYCKKLDKIKKYFTDEAWLNFFQYYQSNISNH